MNNKKNQTQERIILKSKEYFFRYGHNKTNLDDITKELGMSKKTLYKYFENKKALLNAVAEQVMKEVEERINQLTEKKTLDFSFHLKEIIEFFSIFISQVKIFIQDIQRYEPDLWQKINEFRKKKFFENFKKLYHQAQELGFMRDDIPIDLSMRILFGMIEQITNFKDHPDHSHSFKELIDASFKIYFEGMKKN